MNKGQKPSVRKTCFVCNSDKHLAAFHGKGGGNTPKAANVNTCYLSRMEYDESLMHTLQSAHTPASAETSVKHYDSIPCNQNTVTNSGNRDLEEDKKKLSTFMNYLSILKNWYSLSV